MAISRPLALLVGLLTAWPPVYFVGFTAVVLGAVGGDAFMGDRREFELLFRLHLLTMLVSMGLLAFFVVHCFRNDRVPQERRVMWLLVLFLGNMFAFPVYWYLHVWRR